MNETIDKLNKKSIRLRIIGLSLVCISFIIFLVFTSYQGKKIEVQQVIIAKKDSSLSVYIDSTRITRIHLSKQDSLLSIVNLLLRYRSEHKADSMQALFSEKVVRYFKNLHNTSNKTIAKYDKIYWKQYPNDMFTLTAPIKILSDSTGDKAIINGTQCRDGKKCIEEIVEIRFDENKKINYARAYYAN